MGDGRITKCYLGCDPGLNKPAIALLDQDARFIFVQTKTMKGKFDSKMKDLLAFTDACKRIVGAIHIKNWRNHIELKIETPRLNVIAVIEYPQYEESERGRAALKSGALVKLSAAFGVLYAGLAEISTSLRAVSIPAWKGQEPKTITRDRMRRIFGENTVKGLTEDEVDALGLAYYAAIQDDPNLEELAKARGTSMESSPKPD